MKIQSRPPAKQANVDIARIEAMLLEQVNPERVSSARIAAARAGGMLDALLALGHVESFDLYYSHYELTVEVVKDGVDHTFDYTGY